MRPSSCRCWSRRSTISRCAWPVSLIVPRRYRSFFVRLFEARGNRYSHEHVLVLERDGDVAAAILAYPGSDEAMLAAPVLAARRVYAAAADYRHEPESSADEFYIDALTVAPRHRGAGHAETMIAAACRRAADRGHERIGLLVDVDKPGVKRLYAKLGFVVDGERRLAGHRYEHMSRASDRASGGTAAG